jgi:hypothetical protein
VPFALSCCLEFMCVGLGPELCNILYCLCVAEVCGD